MIVSVGLVPASAGAASFSAQDLRALTSAIRFMQPQPTSDAIIAIVYATGDAASRRDADAIAALIGDGLATGQAILRPRVVDIKSVNSGGSHIVVIIAAAAAIGPTLYEVTRIARALCVTADVETVRAGFCAMAITAVPRVEIIVNHLVTAAAGIEFAASFRLMIREI